MIWKNEKRKLSDLSPAKYNPRKMSAKARADLAASLDRFGMADPLIINTNGTIIGGHQRFSILKDRGTLEVDVMVPETQLPEAMEKELNLRLNQNKGEFDLRILASFDEEMLQMVGFESSDLDRIFDVETNEKDDLVPTKAPSICRRGDIYQLGDHRLMCGDSIDEADVFILLNGKKANFSFTSPPYWVGFAYENEKEKETILSHINKSAYLLTKFVSGKIIINTGNLNSIDKAEKITGKKQPALLIDWWIDALNKNNFLLRHIRVWSKMGGVMPSRRNDKIDMHWEYLALFTDEGGNAGFIATFKNGDDVGGQNIGTPEWAVKGVWGDIQGKAREAGHCASFPVELVERYLMMYTSRGMIDYEPYAGAGTSFIACEKTNRICYGMEIDEHYCDVIIKRWEDFTGKKAVKF